MTRRLCRYFTMNTMRDPVFAVDGFTCSPPTPFPPHLTPIHLTPITSHFINPFSINFRFILYFMSFDSTFSECYTFQSISAALLFRRFAAMSARASRRGLQRARPPAPKRARNSAVSGRRLCALSHHVLRSPTFRRSHSHSQSRLASPHTKLAGRKRRCMTIWTS